jgi:hypothetical protein
MAERFFGNRTTVVEGQAALTESLVQAAISGNVLRASRIVPGHTAAGAHGKNVEGTGLSVTLLAPGSSLGPYLLDRVLGAGSTGAVYAATDVRSRQPVAIKVLHSVQASKLVAFKSEFRLALRVAHRNLLSPYELFAEADRWFIAMERVDGPDFLSFVRDHASLHYHDERLREALLQVVAGLEALHDAGIVHRDLKPANVLVDGDGSVRIVDFGLAVLRDGQQAWLDEAGRVVGSPAYMAPEQAAGEPPSPEADLYCVGVMLFEALTGRLPFQGATMHELVLNKLACDARDPRELAPGVSQELAELTLRLLSRVRSLRPSLNELRASLQHQQVSPLGAPIVRRDARLIGREPELGLLEQAFATLSEGTTKIVLVEGRSGVGKSALVAEACERFARAGALVLRGTCHMLEYIPFKGFDGVVDALRAVLRSLSEPARAALLPADLLSAAAMFPVLEDLCPQPALRVERDEPLDREQGYAAFKATLRALSRERPLVIALDDTQWGDRDGASLLSYLLAEESEALPVLFVIVHRDDEQSRGDFMHALTSLPSAGQRLQRMLVSPLATELAVELARSLLDRSDLEQARRIAEEAAGEPFLVEQLARHATAPSGPCTLYDVIRTRAAELDPRALRLLELSAVAGQPLPQALLESCLALTDGRLLVSQLVSLSLLRRTGSVAASLVQPYHDRIRDVVSEALDERARSGLHLLLASHGEDRGLLPASALVDYFTLGGAPERALPHALAAAGAAESALAFDLAADTYARTLLLSEALGIPSLRAQVGHARCLHRAGRCAEAGASYIQAAHSARGRERQLLQSGAIEAWLACGRLGSALQVLRPLLASIGSGYPEGTRRVALSLLYGIAHAKLSLRVRPPLRARGENLGSSLRADLLWDAGKGLMPIATPQAAVLCFGSLRASLACGDAHRVGRALAFVGSGFVPLLTREGLRCLRWARELADEHGDEHLRIMVHVAEAAQFFLSGRWSAAIERCERVLALSSRCAAPTAWEQSVAHTLLVSAHEYRGSLREMEESIVRCLRSLQSRGDQITAVTIVSAHGYVHAARHDRAGLLRAIQDMTAAMRDWTVGFGVWDFYKLRLQTLQELCWGQLAEARSLLDGAWPELKRHHLLHTPIVRGPALVLRLSVLLAQLRDGGLAQRALRREISSLSATLARESRPDARIHALIARAALAWRARRVERCHQLLERAETLAREADLRVVVRMIERQRALLDGRESDRIQKEAELAQRGVADAAAWALYIVPGFPPSSERARA